MSLSQSELRRIRYELGYNILNAGAEPYVGTHSVFDQVVQTYMQGGASTTSTTTVTAATSPTPVTLALASATGFTTGDVVIIDVDDRQERATIQSLVGGAMTVLLSKAHLGTFPVTVEGGESMVRELLARLREVDDKIAESRTSAGLKSVGRGAVEWFSSGSVLSSLKKIQMDHRDELASLLGVPNLWRRRSGGGRCELY
jgi:hypothetical protein